MSSKGKVFRYTEVFTIVYNPVVDMMFFYNEDGRLIAQLDRDYAISSLRYSKYEIVKAVNVLPKTSILVESKNWTDIFHE